MPAQRKIFLSRVKCKPGANARSLAEPSPCRHGARGTSAAPLLLSKREGNEVSSRGLHLSCQRRKKSAHKHRACSNPARSISQPFLLQPKGNSPSWSSSRLTLQVLGCATPPRSPLPLISTQQQSKIAFPFFKGRDFWSFQAVISLVHYLGEDFSTKKRALTAGKPAASNCLTSKVPKTCLTFQQAELIGSTPALSCPSIFG